MKLMFKALDKLLCEKWNYLYAFLFMSLLIPFMYFFIMFSIDKNISNSSDIYLAKMALNTTVAYSFLFSFTFLSCFIVYIFFYFFYNRNKKDIACIKALGFLDISIYAYICLGVVLICIIGGILAMFIAYYASSILVNFYEQYYNIDIIRGISVKTAMTGIILPVVSMCFITCVSYLRITKKPVSELASDNFANQSNAKLLVISDKFANLFPAKYKLSIKIVLRKPVSLLLLTIAVIGFSVMFFLSYSLVKSNDIIFESQIKGHNYLFESHYNTRQLNANSHDKQVFYTEANCSIQNDNIAQKIIGLEYMNIIMQLENKDGWLLKTLPKGYVYIPSALHELYGYDIGDKIKIDINNNEYEMEISDIAINAKSQCIYMNKEQLDHIMGMPKNSYTSILSIIPIENADKVITHKDKMNMLEIDIKYNNINANINEFMGAVSGIILIFLALLMNFESNSSDILILHLNNYTNKEIKNIFVDVYYRVIIVIFLITLPAIIWLAKNIQKNFSLMSGVYMPFSVSTAVVLFTIFLLTVIYLGLQLVFSKKISNIVKNDSIFCYIK